MAYDRPSWKDIDKARDGSSRRKRRSKDKKELKEHSTRYDKYKADLNRLFDQGLAGELIKKTSTEAGAKEEQSQKAPKKKKEDKAVSRRKGGGRIPKDTSKATSRLKLIRTIQDAQDSQALIGAIDELVERFGLPDDWEVLVRVCEHHDEDLIARAISRMLELLPQAKKVPRKASLKERLRTIGQTASDSQLRQLAEQMESEL